MGNKTPNLLTNDCACHKWLLPGFWLRTLATEYAFILVPIAAKIRLYSIIKYKGFLQQLNHINYYATLHTPITCDVWYLMLRGVLPYKCGYRALRMWDMSDLFTFV